MLKLIVGVLAAVTATLAILLGVGSQGQVDSALTKSYILVPAAAPLQFAPLLTGDKHTFGPQQLRGHWSLVFFGFTACPLVCPRTLSLLKAAAHLPSTGISSGATHALFVSIDPDRDTPEKVRSYVSHFDSLLVGITGNGASIEQFSRQIGAGYQSDGSSIDHSTSLFVVDPHGRLAGIVLHPIDASQIASDFERIRLSRE